MIDILLPSLGCHSQGKKISRLPHRIAPGNGLAVAVTKAKNFAHRFAEQGS